MIKTRYLKQIIKQDALKDHKIAFISGPRQVGKTTLGKQILKTKGNYFSYDESQFKKIWAKNPVQILDQLGPGPLLLDEIHKDRRWKTKLKGIYDTYSYKLPILVTGSAKLDIYRRGSDSLLGRYLPYRLHPFSVAESFNPSLKTKDLLKNFKVKYPWNDLMILGGYPEPLLSTKEQKALRWSRLRLDRLAFEDIREIKTLYNLNAFRVLLDLVPEKIGSLFSFHSLKEDVGVAYGTIRDWMLLSEILYYGFFIKPYFKNFKRAIKKEPKFYLYDILQIPKIEKAKRLENLSALHLLKACHFLTDIAEDFFELNFVRDKEKREVDFLITKDKTPWMLIECKSNSKNLSPHLIYYKQKLKTKLNFQLIDEKNYHKKHHLQNIHVINYEKFFAGMI